MGYRDVADVMQGWMDSPPHKKNILGDFTEIGVARVVRQGRKPYWCADFGKPMPKFDPATAVEDLVKRINEERAAGKLPALDGRPETGQGRAGAGRRPGQEEEPGGRHRHASTGSTRSSTRTSP